MSETKSDYETGLIISQSFDAGELALSITEIVEFKHPPHHRCVQHLRFYMEDCINDLQEQYNYIERELMLENRDIITELCINQKNAGRINEVLLELVSGELKEIHDLLTKEDTSRVVLPKKYLDLARIGTKEITVLAYLMDFSERAELTIQDIA